MTVLPTVTLNDGVEMPVLGFGIGTAHMMNIAETGNYVEAALQAGYRSFDSSTMYHTNAAAGPVFAKWMKQGKVKRDELFITGKGGEAMMAPEDFDMRKWAEESVRDDACEGTALNNQLQVEYLDLFSIHAEDMVSDIQKAWRQMEQLQRDGLAKSIGVGDVGAKRLKEILDICEIKPAAIQIEFHPHALAAYDPELHRLCVDHGIRVQAVSALNPMRYDPMKDADVINAVDQIRETRNKGEDQADILLLWAKQQGGGCVLTERTPTLSGGVSAKIISTSTKPERMTHLLDIFSASYPQLSEQHQATITKAGQSLPFRQWGKMWPYLMNGEGVPMEDPALTYWNKRPQWLEGWDKATRSQ